jgi:hypothetical protein
MYGIVGPGGMTGFSFEALDINDSGLIAGVLHATSGSRDRALVRGTSLSVLPTGDMARKPSDQFEWHDRRRGSNAAGRLATAMWSPTHTLTLLKDHLTTRSSKSSAASFTRRSQSSPTSFAASTSSCRPISDSRDLFQAIRVWGMRAAFPDLCQKGR